MLKILFLTKIIDLDLIMLPAEQQKLFCYKVVADHERHTFYSFRQKAGQEYLIVKFDWLHNFIFP